MIDFRRLSPHAYWIATLLAVVIVWQFQKCTARQDAVQWGVDKQKLAVSDSTNRELVKEARELSVTISQLRADYAKLAAQGVQTAATFRHELARWRALAGRVDTVTVGSDSTVAPVPSDSLPTLLEIIGQANRTIASCQANTANCEQRAANAELRASSIDSLRANAEARASQYLLQSQIWRRKAMPSLWEQMKQIPRKAVTSTALLSVGYATCRLTGK